MNRYPPTDQWVEHAKNRAGFLAIIPKHGVGAEIGVYCGDFTQYILDICEPTTLHLIDLWTLLGESWEQWGIHGPSTAEALATVQETCAGRIKTGQVEVHEADDLQLLPTFADDYFDWAYLDTSHQYEQTAAELKILDLKVKPGGIICGDDWTVDPDHPHHGVNVAVNEFMDLHPDYQWLYCGDDLQWAITKP